MNKYIWIFTPYLSKSMGGIQNLSYYLFVYLQKEYKVYAFSANIDNKMNKENIYFSYFYKNQFLIAIDLLVRSFLKSIKEKSYINISLTWRLGIIAYILKLIFDIPYIVYIHGNDIYPNNKNKFTKFIIKVILSNSKSVISNSKYTKKLALDYGVQSEKIKIIHPGIEFKKIKDNYKKNEKKIMFSLCRLEKRKGIDNTIKALPNIIKNFPNLHYYIGGKGPYFDDLKQISKELNLSEYITFLGFINENLKEEMYKKCDLFVMPSYEVSENGSVEGFGIVYLEANKFGKFVIGGNSGGAPEAVKDKKTGFVVDGNNPRDIEKSIIKFFSEKKYENRYSKYCLDWAEKHDWSNIIDQVRKLI